MKGLSTWDIETTIRELFKRKASPWHEDNWTVCHGVRRADGEQHLHYFGHTKPADGWLLPVLQGTRILAGFNIKFDILHALVDSPLNLEGWMAWVAKGGMIWDCQLAEYLLNGMTQKDQMLSLDEVAPRYGGQLKHDEVKALWAAGINTPDIDKDLLLRYLGGGEDGSGEYRNGDLENTEVVALAQIERAKECGQLNSILLNMGSLLCSVEMERNGMFCDVDEGARLAAIMEEQVAALHAGLSSYLPALPFEFNWGSPAQRSALIFGGKIKYPRREYQQLDGSYSWHSDSPTQAYTQRDEVVGVVSDTIPGLGYTDGDGVAHEVIAGMTLPVELAAQFSVPLVRYTSGKNAGEVKTKKVKVPDLSKPKSRMGEDVFTFPRLTAPKAEWAGSDPGVWSTAADVIEELGTRDIPFLKALAQLQALSKDLGTYFITTDKHGKQKGMLTLVGGDGIIHHKINHTSTVTGRFSSSDPNLQNIPKGNKSKVKTLFRSRWGADGVIIQSDFASLEVYVQAILTKCAQLIEDLRLGMDMHCMRLSVAEHKAYDEVLLLCKGDAAKGIEPVKEWDYKRTNAKVFSFQRAYGAGVAKIATSTGMPESEVQALVEAENIRYPEIDLYYAALTAEIQKNRKQSSTFAPHPVTKQMVQLGRSYYRTPDGKLYAYTESPSPEFMVKRGVLASFSPTEIRNYVVQGTGGEWMKAAMWLLVRAFYERRNFGGLALLVNTVHDAAYADAHNDVKEDAAALIHACMEEASTLMEYLFSWEVPVPVPSDTTWGPSMMQELPIPGVREKADAYREGLRAKYMRGYTPTFTR